MHLDSATIALLRSLPEFSCDDESQCAVAEAEPEVRAETPPADGDAIARFGGLHAAIAALQRAAANEQPADAAEAARDAQAQQVVDEGGLRSPGPKPPATQEEKDRLAAAVAAADDDAAVRLANDPRAMAIATPEQKAGLIRKLMDGHTNGDEEQAIKKIALSCTSREELDKVIAMSGGIAEFADELDACDLQQIVAHATELTKKQDATIEIVIQLLQQAESPEEFERLYKKLGGDALKHKLPQPPNVELIGRLEALAQKYDMPNVGFRLPPEKTAALQAALQKAIAEGDCDAIVKLSENSDAMKVATPAQKAQMIRELQDGWTKDSQDLGVARILTSCDSKAEFDAVVDMAGGREILDDIDYGPAKADINKLMGGFDRLDCADDVPTAKAYQGCMMPPAVGELTRTREPSDDERDGVLGKSPYSKADRADPALADAARRADAARTKAGAAAYEMDPMARNKLAMANRERQLDGQPPLDYTSLVTKAYAVANDPAFEAEVERAIADAERQGGPLDAEARQEIREQILAHKLSAVAREYGLSEQDLKTLVVAKMGRVLQEGAAAVQEAGAESLQSMALRLQQVERDEGPDCAEAKKLRAAMQKTALATQATAQRLQQTGATAANLFKVPPSFAEDLVGALSVIGDVLAAVVNVIPGVGQAISAAYFGVKAIVGLANGDILGAFKSLLSAVPGFSGVFGAASAAINTGAKVVQAGIAAGEGIANGNPLAFASALGGAAGNLGIDVGGFVPAGVKDAVEKGVAVGRMVDGVAHGDFGVVLGAALPDQLRALGAGALADELDAVGASPAAQAFRQTAGQVAQVVDAIGRGDATGVGRALLSWLPQLASHDASRAVADLAARAQSLLLSPLLDQARRAAQDATGEVQRVLEQIAALQSRAGDLRRFEDAAMQLGNRDARAIGAELLRALGLR